MPNKSIEQISSGSLCFGFGVVPTDCPAESVQPGISVSKNS